jgi:hypothetical protein
MDKSHHTHRDHADFSFERSRSPLADRSNVVQAKKDFYMGSRKQSKLNLDKSSTPTKEQFIFGDKSTNLPSTI